MISTELKKSEFFEVFSGLIFEKSSQIEEPLGFIFSLPFEKQPHRHT
jgi:hypothetical protein